jgi:hypothetical protein
MDLDSEYGPSTPLSDRDHADNVEEDLVTNEPSVATKEVRKNSNSSSSSKRSLSALERRTLEAFADPALCLSQVPSVSVDIFFKSELQSTDLEHIRSVAQCDPESLTALQECFSEWVSSPPADANMWALLAEHHISYRPLMVLLYALIEAQEPQTSLPAANLYVTMMRVPGQYKRESLLVVCLFFLFQRA